jgi:RimJ/RimL family protein N-acetyltransferase
MLLFLKNNTFFSSRLLLSPLQVCDAEFVLELFNTKDWLKFIGDRNIHTILDAENFIRGAIENKNAMIWTIKLKENTSNSIGVITLIKRDYLTFPDIGYALLPLAMKYGFAYEATQKVIYEIHTQNNFELLNAITLPSNLASIKLLKKLGFKFSKEFFNQNETLDLYELHFKNHGH